MGQGSSRPVEYPNGSTSPKELKKLLSHPYLDLVTHFWGKNLGQTLFFVYATTGNNEALQLLLKHLGYPGADVDVIRPFILAKYNQPLSELLKKLESDAHISHDLLVKAAERQQNPELHSMTDLECIIALHFSGVLKPSPKNWAEKKLSYLAWRELGWQFAGFENTEDYAGNAWFNHYTQQVIVVHHCKAIVETMGAAFLPAVKFALELNKKILEQGKLALKWFHVGAHAGAVLAACVSEQYCGHQSVLFDFPKQLDVIAQRFERHFYGVSGKLYCSDSMRFCDKLGGAMTYLMEFPADKKVKKQLPEDTAAVYYSLLTSPECAIDIPLGTLSKEHAYPASLLTAYQYLIKAGKVIISGKLEQFFNFITVDIQHGEECLLVRELSVEQCLLDLENNAAEMQTTVSAFPWICVERPKFVKTREDLMTLFHLRERDKDIMPANLTGLYEQMLSGDMSVMSSDKLAFYLVAKEFVKQCLGKALPEQIALLKENESIKPYLYFVVGLACKEKLVGLLGYIFDEVLKDKFDPLLEVMILGEGYQHFNTHKNFAHRMLRYVKKPSALHKLARMTVGYEALHEHWGKHLKLEEVKRRPLVFGSSGTLWRQPKVNGVSQPAVQSNPAPVSSVPNWLGEHDVNVYLRCFVESQGGYADHCHFRLKEKIKGRYVAITPAVDREGCSLFPIALDYFLDKNKQVENSGVLILGMLQANFENFSAELTAYKALQASAENSASQTSSEAWGLLKAAVSSLLVGVAADDDTLNWAMHALIEAGSADGLTKRVQQVDGAKNQRHDVLDELEEILNLDEVNQIDIIMPLWINKNHWTSLQITIDKQMSKDGHAYIVDVVQHDPKLSSKDRRADINILKDFDVISEAVAKRIREVDKKLKHNDKYAVKCQTSMDTFDKPRQQQYDNDSCAVIMCDDVEKIILRQNFSNTQTYPDKAFDLREAQIAFVSQQGKNDPDAKQYVRDNQARIRYFKQYDEWLRSLEQQQQPSIAELRLSQMKHLRYGPAAKDDIFNPNWREEMDREYDGVFALPPM